MKIGRPSTRIGMEPSGVASQNLRGMLEDSDRFLTAVEIETSRGLLMADTADRV